MRKLRSRLTYANVTATLALVIAVAGGTAYAANTITSTDIVNGQVKSVDIGNNQVQGIDVKFDSLDGTRIADESIGTDDVGDGSLTGDDVNDGTLTGVDIAPQSGVETCTHGTVRTGELCVGVANEHHTWADAAQLCANLELRLPSLGEALELAQNHDLPNVGESEFFWTGNRYYFQNAREADIVNDGGDDSVIIATDPTSETVCVTTPTN
jgi:hypothetical protein